MNDRLAQWVREGRAGIDELQRFLSQHSKAPEVLLVEDNPVDMELLRAQIARLRIKGSAPIIVECFSSEQAVEIIKYGRIDVCFIDMDLTTSNTLRVLETVSDSKQTKYIIVAGSTQNISAAEVAALGAVLALQKPLTDEQIKLIFEGIA